VGDVSIQAFIRQRRAAMRWRSLLGTMLCVLIVVALLEVKTRLSPTQAALGAAAIAAMAGICALQLAGTFQPVRYRGGPLTARRSLIGALAYSIGAIILGTLAALFGRTMGPIGYAMLLPAAVGIGLAILRIPEVFDRRVILTIDSRGFFDRRFTHRPLTWTELGPLVPSASSYAWPVFRPATETSSSTLMRRIFTRLGFPFLYVSFGGLDHGGADALLAIDHYAPELTSALAKGDRVQA
jgi:hypothetical protein